MPSCRCLLHRKVPWRLTSRKTSRCQGMKRRRKYDFSKARDFGPTRHGRREELVGTITSHRSLPTPLLSTIPCTSIAIGQYLDTLRLLSVGPTIRGNHITSLRRSCDTACLSIAIGEIASKTWLSRQKIGKQPGVGRDTSSLLYSSIMVPVGWDDTRDFSRVKRIYLAI